MVRASRIVSATVFLMVLLPATVWGVDNKWSRETLQGINGAYLVVEVVEPEIERAGLTRVQIKADVELKLRMTGLKCAGPGRGDKDAWEAVACRISKHSDHRWCVHLRYYAELISRCLSCAKQ